MRMKPAAAKAAFDLFARSQYRSIRVLIASLTAATLCAAFFYSAPNNTVGASRDLSGPAADPNTAMPGPSFENDFAAGEILIAFHPGTARGKMTSTRNGIGASAIKEFPEIGVHHWRLPDTASVEQVVEALSHNPNVRFAEPNYIVSTDQLPASPDDAFRGDLWGLHNLGQTSGTAGVDISAPEAWSVTTGASNVVIGVIDSGIDYNHPDLQANIWTNAGEVAGNNIDDDGNGYIDDVRGWDFANNDNDPMDDNGHGTHVSGTIGAVGNNGVGVVGVNWNCRLMPLKFLAANGQGTTAAAIGAILYAASFTSGGSKVVRITNNSWGGGKRSSALQDAIGNSGSLFVAASGNGGSSQAQFPAGYNNANILSVAATDHKDALATFSNYGSNWVDLAAPGVNIYSSYRGGEYRYMSGTSMASPHVAGVAGLIIASNSGLAVADIKSRIMTGVDPVAALAGKTVTGGRLNAARAVGASIVLSDNCASAPCAPDDVTDLSVDDLASTPTSLTLRWTATGDDGGVGSAYLEDVRYSTAPIDAGNFAQASIATGEPVPASAGSPNSFEVRGLRPSTTYHFAMRVADEVGNYSGLATATGTTTQAPWTVSVIDDTANDLGFYSSLAYDGEDNPAIAYSDYTVAQVKLARWNGAAWEISTASTSGRTGIDLAFNSSSIPSVTYGWGKMEFSQYVPSSNSWQVTVLESRNAYNDVTSHAYAPNGDPSVSYRTSTNSGRGDLKFARRTATGWVIQTVAAAGARYSSLAYDGSGNPGIAFSDDVNGDNQLDTLKLARWNGTSWTVQVVETGVNGYGVHSSLVFDSDGNPAITHVSGGVVRFVRWTGSSWAPAETNVTGSNASLLYNNGSFHVSYTLSDNTVNVATRDAAGVWTTEPVAFGDRPRWLVPMALSPCGTPSVAFSTSPNNDVRFSTKCPL